MPLLNLHQSREAAGGRGVRRVMSHVVTWHSQSAAVLSSTARVTDLEF